jgi:hypothetical protein
MPNLFVGSRSTSQVTVSFGLANRWCLDWLLNASVRKRPQYDNQIEGRLALDIDYFDTNRQKSSLVILVLNRNLVTVARVSTEELVPVYAEDTRFYNFRRLQTEHQIPSADQ